MRYLIVLTVGFAAGCSSINFKADDGKGLLYFEPVPVLAVRVDKDCKIESTVMSLPGQRRHVRMSAGYGSSELTLDLSNGIITKVGQTVDTKVPETLTAFAGLYSAITPATADEKITIDGDTQTRELRATCTPSVSLYAIEHEGGSISISPTPLFLDRANAALPMPSGAVGSTPER